MDLSLLSNLNPQTLLTKAAVVIGWSLICVVGGFYGGCQYKQNQWDAEKFHEMEKAKGVEKTDKNDGIKKVEEFKQDTKQAEEGKDFVRKGIQEHRPNIRVVEAPKVSAPAQVVTKEGTVKNEETGVYLTANFMRLYDVSSAPGLAELRTRAYDETNGPTLDEGFEKIIVPNNQKCAAERLQLTKLIERIEQKQKLYKKSVDQGVF
jgi:hypothetical protein